MPDTGYVPPSTGPATEAPTDSAVMQSHLRTMDNIIAAHEDLMRMALTAPDRLQCTAFIPPMAHHS